MMDAATLRHLPGWGVVVHYAILLVGFAAFVFAHDGLYRLHRRGFRQLTPQGFDAVHYGGMAVDKLLVMTIWLVPWLLLALR